MENLCIKDIDKNLDVSKIINLLKKGNIKSKERDRLFFNLLYHNNLEDGDQVIIYFYNHHKLAQRFFCIFNYHYNNSRYLDHLKYNYFSNSLSLSETKDDTSEVIVNYYFLLIHDCLYLEENKCGKNNFSVFENVPFNIKLHLSFCHTYTINIDELYSIYLNAPEEQSYINFIIMNTCLNIFADLESDEIENAIKFLKFLEIYIKKNTLLPQAKNVVLLFLLKINEHKQVFVEGIKGYPVHCLKIDSLKEPKIIENFDDIVSPLDLIYQLTKKNVFSISVAYEVILELIENYDLDFLDNVDTKDFSSEDKVAHKEYINIYNILTNKKVKEEYSIFDEIQIYLGSGDKLQLKKIEQKLKEIKVLSFKEAKEIARILSIHSDKSKILDLFQKHDISIQVYDYLSSI